MIAQNVFSQYIERPSLFNNKTALTTAFLPSKIPHRENEILQMTQILAPLLKGYSANNIFIYGTCGTGKTICSRFVARQLEDIAKACKHPIKTIYINCKMKKVADTEYRLLAQMLKDFGDILPDTGLPTDVLYRRFFSRIDENSQNIVLILDEIDALIKKVGDEFLYNLTRINDELKRSKLNIIGITNDLSFRDNLDMRVKSSLSEEEIIFRPYNALEIKNILQERVSEGFLTGVVGENVINKCAAIAAQEHGDARRALDLLRVAGELAERTGETRLSEDHIDSAEQKLDIDRVTETVKTQPRQSQAVLYAVLTLSEMKKLNKDWTDKRILTGDVFHSYEKICNGNGMKMLTQRRVSDLIAELDMLGIISAKVISKGRYGRTREISLSLSEQLLEKVGGFLSGRFV